METREKRLMKITLNNLALYLFASAFLIMVGMKLIPATIFATIIVSANLIPFAELNKLSEELGETNLLRKLVETKKDEIVYGLSIPWVLNIWVVLYTLIF